MAENLCRLTKCKYQKECKQKNNPFKCNILCRGYEEYVNQDYINRKEVLFTEINLQIENALINNNYMQLDRKKQIIKFFFFYKMPIKKIAEQLYCSEQYVYKIIRDGRDVLFKHFKLRG